MPVMFTMSASGHVHVLELYTCLFIALEGMLYMLAFINLLLARSGKKIAQF